MLIESDVISLYKMKLDASFHCQSMKGRSGPVSKLFGVTARTVRDIWNRKTWAYATRHLWPREDSFALGGDWTESITEVFLNLNLLMAWDGV
jgi:hypothetical protein